MLIHWTHIGSTILAAFLASLVECVDALTVVLAVGFARGRRVALPGTSVEECTVVENPAAVVVEDVGEIIDAGVSMRGAYLQ